MRRSGIESDVRGHSKLPGDAVTGHLDFLSCSQMAMDLIVGEPDYLGASSVLGVLSLQSEPAIFHERLA